jgi:hypothetical protein
MQNLTIIIVLPIIGFLILVALTSLCCFCLIRHRRKLAKRRGQSQHPVARWDDTTTSTPWNTWAGDSHQTSPYQSPGMTNSSLQQMITPMGAGFSIVDNDGKQYEAGYSTKSGDAVSYVSPMSHVVSVPPQAFHFDNDPTALKPAENMTLSKQEEELQQYQLQHWQQVQHFQQMQQTQAQQAQAMQQPQMYFQPLPGATPHST